jgi:hypothetical protein
MEMKGKFPCRSPVCSVSAGDHSVPRTKKRRHQLTTTPCSTPGHPRARIRTKVLLRHILEAPLHGRVGIDLHLGQKPKLGGRYANDSLIYISYFVGTLYIHVSLSFLSCFDLISTLQNRKRPKIFPLFLFVCLFNFLALLFFVSYFQFGI